MNERSGQKHNMLFMITSLYGGGAEKVCCILASEMAKHNNVTLLYLNDNAQGRSYPIDSRVELIRFPYRSCSIKRSPLRWLAYRWLNIRGIRKIKKEKNTDVSVSLLMAPNLLNVFSRAGDRVITSERANPRIYQPKRFWLTKLAYGRSDHVVFQSAKVQGFYGRKVQEKSSIIMNPVSVVCMAAQERKHRIVSAGRLTEQKNHRMLINSFAQFHISYPEYTLTIYGAGPLMEELKGLASALGVAEYVFLPGNVDDIHEQIKDAEMFVLSSNFEGLSNALLEAMTMGIACISTRCEGSTNVIRNGENGLLTDIGDGDALTDCMCDLAAHPGLRKRLETAAKEDAKGFDKDAVIHKWKEVFFPGEPN